MIVRGISVFVYFMESINHKIKNVANICHHIYRYLYICLTLTLTIVDQCDIKHSRMLQMKTITLVLKVSTYIMTSITAWPIILTLILGINVYIHLNAGLYILPNYSKYILSCLFSNYRKNNL